MDLREALASGFSNCQTSPAYFETPGATFRMVADSDSALEEPLGSRKARGDRSRSGDRMRQGADRSAPSKRGRDFYETVPEATETLIRIAGPRLSRAPKIWEPCAGHGAISRILRERGYKVIASDIAKRKAADRHVKPSIDFFAQRKHPPYARLIITNPPFRYADEFLRHALALGCDVFVLLRLMYLEGAEKSDLLDWHCREVIAIRERLPNMHRVGWRGPKLKDANQPFGWFYFTAAPKISPQITLTRVSCRES
jgi:hypothetical protein